MATKFDDQKCKVGYVNDSGDRVKAHWFQLPTPPAKAVGVCKSCGYKRPHFNTHDREGNLFNR